MLPLFTRCGFEGPLIIVKYSETVQSTALEVAIVVESDADYLLICFHLLDNLKVSAIKNLNVPLIECHKNETIITKGIENLKLSRHFLSNF